MEMPKNLKSKKLLIGAALIGVIVVGFFMLKFMTSGGSDVIPEKPRSGRRSEKKISKPQKKEESKKSPLYEAMEALRDPFRAEDPKAAQLQDKLSITQKEIEYLKATLEEKKLRKEIKEIEEALVRSGRSGSPSKEEGILSSEVDKGEAKPENQGVLVKAIMITDEKRSALLVSGNKKSWVHQGEYFDGWQVKEIRKENVVLSKAGKAVVFFYDRPGITQKGGS
jgi:hypothetical protein